MAGACRDDAPQQGATSRLSGSGCENDAWGPDLIDRSEAEEIAVSALGISAPNVSAVEIRRVDATCLTTLGWYEQDLLEGAQRSNPDLSPPSMPIWIVQVEGKSRYEGPWEERFYYEYAIAVVNAKSGEVFGQGYTFEPLLTP